MLNASALRRATAFTTQRRIACAAYARQLHSGPQEPFRILFCGSDQFSVASLEALYNADGELKSIRRS